MANKRSIDAHQDEEIHKGKFLVTMILVVFLIIVCLLVLDKFGILEGDSGEQLGRADLVCFMSGYPAGVNQDTFSENKTGYYFECSKDNFEIRFDKNSGVGFIGHKKSK